MGIHIDETCTRKYKMCMFGKVFKRVCFNASRKHVFFYQRKPVLKEMRKEKKKHVLIDQYKNVAVVLNKSIEVCMK